MLLTAMTSLAGHCSTLSKERQGWLPHRHALDVSIRKRGGGDAVDPCDGGRRSYPDASRVWPPTASLMRTTVMAVKKKTVSSSAPLSSTAPPGRGNNGTTDDGHRRLLPWAPPSLSKLERCRVMNASLKHVTPFVQAVWGTSTLAVSLSSRTRGRLGGGFLSLRGEFYFLHFPRNGVRRIRQAAAVTETMGTRIRRTAWTMVFFNRRSVPQRDEFYFLRKGV